MIITYNISNTIQDIVNEFRKSDYDKVSDRVKMRIIQACIDYGVSLSVDDNTRISYAEPAYRCSSHRKRVGFSRFVRRNANIRSHMLSDELLELLELAVCKLEKSFTVEELVGQDIPATYIAFAQEYDISSCMSDDPEAYDLLSLYADNPDNISLLVFSMCAGYTSGYARAIKFVADNGEVFIERRYGANSAKFRTLINNWIAQQGYHDTEKTLRTEEGYDSSIKVTVNLPQSGQWPYVDTFFFGNRLSEEDKIELRPALAHDSFSNSRELCSGLDVKPDSMIFRSTDGSHHSAYNCVVCDKPFMSYLEDYLSSRSNEYNYGHCVYVCEDCIQRGYTLRNCRRCSKTFLYNTDDKDYCRADEFPELQERYSELITKHKTAFKLVESNLRRGDYRDICLESELFSSFCAECIDNLLNRVEVTIPSVEEEENLVEQDA